MNLSASYAEKNSQKTMKQAPRIGKYTTATKNVNVVAITACTWMVFKLGKRSQNYIKIEKAINLALHLLECFSNVERG